MQGLGRISFQTSEEEHCPHPACKKDTVDAPFLCSSGLLCPDPFSKFQPAIGTHSIRKAFQMKSAMQQIVISDADNYPGLLQVSFKAFSYSSLPSFQLKLNTGLKEISLAGNSFSFSERKAMLLPFSVHFFAFLFPAARWRQ